MALGLFVAAVSGVAHGQPAPKDGTSRSSKRTTIREELQGEARRSWNSAVELFEARDYQAARVEFQRAFELSQNPRVLFNVGVCDKNLQKYARAVSVWKRQIDLGASSLSSDDLQQTRDAIAAVEQFVSSIQLSVDVPGTALSIDDDQLAESPFASPIAVDVGRHTLRLRKQGYQDQTIEVTVASGKIEQLSVTLEPLVRTSLVSVAVTGGPGASVFVDGIDMGPAPFKGQVVAGRHTIEARSPGFVTARQTSEIAFGRPLDLLLTLARERHEGKVRIAADEPDAVIQVDGKVVGSGAWAGVLASGGHQLVVKKPGFVTYAADIALSDDQVRTLSVPMRREERGAAWVWWTAGTVAVVAGGAIAGYFIFRPTDQAPVSGTWSPGLVPARWY